MENKLNNLNKRNLLVCDTAYTYEFLIERNLQELVTCKDVDGYFDHVWTVHAVASLFHSHASGLRYGRPVIRKLNERHTHIEGKIGLFKRLAWFPSLNFILAQLDLIGFLLKLSKQNQIEIIRAEDPTFNGILGLIISSIRKLPLVIGVWGNPGAIRENTGKPVSARLKWVWLEETVERFVLRRATTVLVQNYDNQGFVLRQGVQKDKTVITRIGSAIDPSHFISPNKRQSGLADLKALGIDGELIIMGVFRLIELKLPDHLIRVVALLKDRGYKVKGVFAGDGHLKDELVSLSEELDVSDQIVFCGNRDQIWLSRVLPHVSVIISTLTGRALAETALSAVPIVAYDIDWHGEAIETGITGELVPYSNYLHMADAVEKILNDKEYSKMIGVNARKRMLKLMDPKASDQVLINLYEDLLTSGTSLK